MTNYEINVQIQIKQWKKNAFPLIVQRFWVLLCSKYVSFILLNVLSAPSCCTAVKYSWRSVFFGMRNANTLLFFITSTPMVQICVAK